MMDKTDESWHKDGAGRRNAKKLARQLHRLLNTRSGSEFVRVQVARPMDQVLTLEFAPNPEDNGNSLLILWINGVLVSERMFVKMDFERCGMSLIYLSTMHDDNFQLMRVDFNRIRSSHLHGKFTARDHNGLTRGDDVFYMILRGRTARRLNVDNIWDGLAVMSFQSDENRTCNKEWGLL